MQALLVEASDGNHQVIKKVTTDKNRTYAVRVKALDSGNKTAGHLGLVGVISNNFLWLTIYMTYLCAQD